MQDSGLIKWSCGCECAYFLTWDGTESNDLFCKKPFYQCGRFLDREVANRGA